MNKNKVTITAIAALAVLEGAALATGTDGATLGIVVTAISGLGGYFLGKKT